MCIITSVVTVESYVCSFVGWIFKICIVTHCTDDEKKCHVFLIQVICVGSFDKQREMWALDSLFVGKFITQLPKHDLVTCLCARFSAPQEIDADSQAMLQLSQNGQKWHFLTCVRVNAFNIFLYKNTSSHCL